MRLVHYTSMPKNCLIKLIVLRRLDPKKLETAPPKTLSTTPLYVNNPIQRKCGPTGSNINSNKSSSVPFVKLATTTFENNTQNTTPTVTTNISGKFTPTARKIHQRCYIKTSIHPEMVC